MKLEINVMVDCLVENADRAYEINHMNLNFNFFEIFLLPNSFQLNHELFLLAYRLNLAWTSDEI